jgi:hypothetical protein
MRTLAWIRWVSLLVGLAFLGGAGWAASRTMSFLATASSAQGTVVALAESTSTDSNGRRSRIWAPEVEYRLASGETRTFTSSVGSAPPDHQVGERVTVLYDPADPGDARLPDTMSLWLLPIVLSGFGVISGSVGATMFVVRAVSWRREAALRRHGRRVQARFQSVERNGSLTVNGRHPYRIFCQWQDPATGLVHVFKSKNLWFDPTAFVREPDLTVFVDPKRPRRYCVDVSFLPKRAA